MNVDDMPIGELRAAVRKLEGQLTDEREAVSELEDEISDLKGQVGDLKQEVDDTRDDLDNEIKDLEYKLSAAEETAVGVDRLIRWALDAGADPLDMLKQLPDDLAERLRKIVLLRVP